MSPRTFTLALVFVSVMVAALCFWQGSAHAQSYVARYQAAAEARDYATAAAVLREALDDDATPETAKPLYRSALARALLAGGHPEAAAREARACRELDTCDAVLREANVPEPAPAPASSAPPARAAAAPVATARPRLRSSTVRAWAPGTPPRVLWALGGASLATAAVLTGLRAAALDGCAVEGDRARCNDAAALDRARSSVELTTGVNVALGVAAAAVAAGAAWWLVEVAVAPSVTSTGASLTVAGSW